MPSSAVRPTFLVADAETFYCSKTKFSLKRMPTEAYILDPQFQVHGWALSFDGGKSDFVTHKEAVRIFAGLDWSRVVFVAHNAMFDAAILVWRYGHMPKVFVDTLGIANCFIRPYTGRSDLDACSQFLSLPLKSGVLKEVDGKRTDDIIATYGLWDRLAAYAVQDNDNCAHIARTYLPQMSATEQLKLHWTVENYVRGRLRLDVAALTQAYDAVKGEREQLLADAGITDPKLLRSTAKFAEYLESLGIVVEYKDGKKADAQIPAVAKDDPFVRDLLKHPDPRVVAAIKARLAFSSTIEVTRAERLLRMAKATGGKMLFPMRYHAAHTGRPGGADGVNPTNFSRNSPIRKAIKPPRGKVIVAVDASQIEARLVAWINHCWPLVNAFAAKIDVYSSFATTLFGYSVSKALPRERQVGKVFILSAGYGVGAQKTMDTLQAQGIDIDLATCQQYVQTYRSTYPDVLGGGRAAIEALRWAVQTGKPVTENGFTYTPDGILRPSGLWIRYNKLQLDGRELTYYSARYKSWQRLYPGAINENKCQALANDIVGAVHMKYRHDAFMMLYDAVYRLVDEERAQEAAEETVAAMRVPPAWCEAVSDVLLPLDAEAKISHYFA